MDEPTFLQKLAHAEIMSDTTERRDYWRGYIRGLQRAYYGAQFATEADHELWYSLADRHDRQNRERGEGYRDGLRAG